MRTVFFTIGWGTKPGAWVEVDKSILDAGVECGIFKALTVMTYEFNQSHGDPIKFSRKSLPALLQNETIYDDVMLQLSKHFIITADNIVANLEASPEDEGI